MVENQEANAIPTDSPKLRQNQYEYTRDKGNIPELSPNSYRELEIDPSARLHTRRDVHDDREQKGAQQFRKDCEETEGHDESGR